MEYVSGDNILGIGNLDDVLVNIAAPDTMTKQVISNIAVLLLNCIRVLFLRRLNKPNMV